MFYFSFVHWLSFVSHTKKKIVSIFALHFCLNCWMLFSYFASIFAKQKMCNHTFCFKHFFFVCFCFGVFSLIFHRTFPHTSVLFDFFVSHWNFGISKKKNTLIFAILFTCFLEIVYLCLIFVNYWQNKSKIFQMQPNIYHPCFLDFALFFGFHFTF